MNAWIVKLNLICKKTKTNSKQSCNHEILKILGQLLSLKIKTKLRGYGNTSLRDDGITLIPNIWLDHINKLINKKKKKKHWFKHAPRLLIYSLAQIAARLLVKNFEHESTQSLPLLTMSVLHRFLAHTTDKQGRMFVPLVVEKNHTLQVLYSQEWLVFDIKSSLHRAQVDSCVLLLFIKCMM